MNNPSLNRLACLVRHWTWAHEAMAEFEREVANGWSYDDDPVGDRLFGAYYRWCALLCGVSEAALAHGLLAGSGMDTLRLDMDASLPGLRACRELFVVIPPSREEHPRLVDLLRDDGTLQRLRRVHYAFGECCGGSRRLGSLMYWIREPDACAHHHQRERTVTGLSYASEPGTEISSSVPAAALLRRCSSPPACSTRSRIPVRPQCPCRPDFSTRGSMPCPSSRTTHLKEAAP
jgi:hypothetical protein